MRTVNHKNYSEVLGRKTKENVLIIKPKIQQESESTKKTLKGVIDIKNMEMGINKLKKGNKESVILGCDSGEEMEKMKSVVQEKMGDIFEVVESKRLKYKIKIINVGEEELRLDDEDLMGAICRQNRFNIRREDFLLQIEKRLVGGEGLKKEKRTTTSNERKGALIIEVDEITHGEMLGKENINLGWRKCRVFSHFNVRRCFKC